MTRRGTLLLASKGRGRGQQEIQQVTYRVTPLILISLIHSLWVYPYLYLALPDHLIASPKKSRGEER